MILKIGRFFGKAVRYLCIETTSSYGFIALFSDKKKEKEIKWFSQQHSELIVQNIEPFLNKKSNLDIQFIAVDQGPGRFTGVRIGVQFSKVLAYYLSCPIYPCCSLRIMAQPYMEKQDKPVLCLIEAFGKKFYSAVYQKSDHQVQTLLQPSALTSEQIDSYVQQEMLCVGDVYKKKKFLFSEKTHQNLLYCDSKEINSADFSSTVLMEWKQKELTDWKQIEPLYLREPGRPPLLCL